MTEQLALTATQSNGRGLFDASLSELEAVIERGLETFVEVGLALLAIRDGKKYRENYSTFEDYCRERWGWTTRYANYNIQAAEVANKLGTIVPVNEAQARELAPLRQDEQEMVEVWRALKEEHGEKVTAELVKQAVGRRLRLKESEVLLSSESNEWYTPQRYIAAARAVMGGIDLDPASHSAANQIAEAGEFYDIEADGLRREWRGRVWLNPPYGQLTGEFIAKLMEELSSGRVTQAICLINAHATDTNWFQPLWSGVLCFTDHRIDFMRSGDLGVSTSSTHGSVLVYFGPNRNKFINVFRQFGSVVERAD